MTHTAPGHPPLLCTRESAGNCAICERIDPSSPSYNEGYRRLFHPEEFPVPVPAPAPAPIPAPASGSRGMATRPAVRRLPDIPLAGDLVEAAAKRIGADRLAALWERWTGQPCGCKQRQEAMNKATKRLLNWLAPAGGRR